jgi:hypothetical protein
VNRTIDEAGIHFVDGRSCAAETNGRRKTAVEFHPVQRASGNLTRVYQGQRGQLGGAARDRCSEGAWAAVTAGRHNVAGMGVDGHIDETGIRHATVEEGRHKRISSWVRDQRAIGIAEQKSIHILSD